MANSNKYMNEYMKKRYKQRRQMAFEILGNKCWKCKSTENLEIDHIYNWDKRFNFAKFWNIAIHKFIKELEYCQLLCQDCHKEKTIKEKSVPHGGGISGKRNCKCLPCKTKKAEYMKNYK